MTSPSTLCRTSLGLFLRERDIGFNVRGEIIGKIVALLTGKSAPLILGHPTILPGGA